MSRPARHEIEKLATGTFAVAHERIAVATAQRRNKVLIEVTQRGNIGGFVPALSQLAVDSVRETILALADAYVEAFTLAETPADAKVEESLDVCSLQIAGGAIAGVRAELDLISKRTRTPLDHSAGHIEREVHQSRVSALNEAHMELERQRIKAKITARVDLPDRGRPIQLSTPQSPRSRNRGAYGNVQPVSSQRRACIEPYLQRRTLSGVAGLSGVAYSSLHRWRSAQTRLSPENRSKLADHLKVDSTQIPN